MDRMSFQLGGWAVHYYGLILCAAILAAYFLARRQAWRFGLSAQEVDRFALWLVIVSFIGARAYYVLFNLAHYSGNWLEALQVWRGGLSIFGAIIAGAACAYFFSRNKAYGFWQLLDLTALVLPLAQAIGRLGNFVNREAFGAPTDLPWKMFVPAGRRPPEFAEAAYFHPAFAYEGLASLVLFAILFRFRTRLRHGTLALAYLSGYSLIRFLMEFIRTDVFWVAGLNGNQAVAALIFVLSVTVLAWRTRAKMV